MRLFVAINFTDEVKKELVKIRDEIKKNAVSGNFTDDNNLHLTLVFIGEVPSADMAVKAVDGIDMKRFDITIEGVGKFKRSGGDIYYAGVRKKNKLALLQEYVKNKLMEQGFEISQREFSPHVTLGRQVVCKKTDFLQPMVSVAVDKISLMLSQRIEGKLVYTEIHSKDLK